MIVIIQCSQFWSASEIKFWISAQHWPISSKHWRWQPITVSKTQSSQSCLHLWLERALLLYDWDEILGQIFFSLIEIRGRSITTHHITKCQKKYERCHSLVLIYSILLKRLQTSHVSHVSLPDIFLSPLYARCCCCNRINCHLTEFSHQRSERLTSDQWVRFECDWINGWDDRLKIDENQLNTNKRQIFPELLLDKLKVESKNFDE